MIIPMVGKIRPSIDFEVTSFAMKLAVSAVKNKMR
jgi:hypothetical protein